MNQSDFLQSLESTLQLRGVVFSRAALQAFVADAWVLIEDNPDAEFWTAKLVQANPVEKSMRERMGRQNLTAETPLAPATPQPNLEIRRDVILPLLFEPLGMVFFIFLVVLFLVFFAPIPVDGFTTLMGYDERGPDPNDHYTCFHCGIGWPWASIRHDWNEARGVNRWKWTDIREIRLWTRVAFFVLLVALLPLWQRFFQRSANVKNGQGWDVKQFSTDGQTGRV